MPVTAPLSRKFYDRLGDDIANELVDWFNQVDTSYRIELRDLNDRNFEGFDARLEQRVAELRGEIKAEISQVRSEAADTRATLIKWMFVFWTGTAVTNIGTTMALVKLLGYRPSQRTLLGLVRSSVPAEGGLGQNVGRWPPIW